MTNFVITELAKFDLDEIWYFIAHDNPETANRVENEIIDKTVKVRT